MKRKKRDNATLISIQILKGAFVSRRRRLLYHLLPLLSAIVGCLLFLFTLVSFLCPPIVNHHLHRNLRLFEKETEVGSNAVKEIAFRVPRSGGILGRDVWSSKQSGLFYGCCNASDEFPVAESKAIPDRYLMIATSGGLNQQRTGITDAVVAAYILNATLVVPKLDQRSYWKDKSNFSDVFDVDQFISYLSRDVKITKELPHIGNKVVTPYTTRVPRKCTPRYYVTRILPILHKKHVVQLTKFDFRLSNRLEPELQKLRCRANYHALQFTESILEMGRKLVERMRMKSKHFIALHLRFESDMLAFSGCDYGGGERERRALGKIRKRWKTLHKGNPDRERRLGRCPLTPEEVGLMLRALGFGSDVHIYVASGEVYGGDETLGPLRTLFPNFHTKETIASKEELAPFSKFSSRMAALDFIVCDESDVFVTNNNGNMARILAGRRRYFGHKPTIRPNAKKLSRLFTDRNNTTWEEFASRVSNFQIGFMGDPNEVKPGRGEFHENPSSCICEKLDPKANSRLAFEIQKTTLTHIKDEESERRKVTVNERFPEDELNSSDAEDLESENVGEEKSTAETDSKTIIKDEHPELEELFSD